MENKFLFDCANCINKCDGVSKNVYLFKNDVNYSEEKENRLIEQINLTNDFIAKKCEIDGYPDVEILHKESGAVFYIEVKAQRRTFMKTKQFLPDSNLTPSETVALNLSDLMRYFEISKTTNSKIYIMWCLENRPCIVKEKQTMYFFQDVSVLENIYKKYTDSRRFRRKSGVGDVVNGKHLGVVVNYHFSLNELRPFRISSVLEEGIR